MFITFIYTGDVKPKDKMMSENQSTSIAVTEIDLKVCNSEDTLILPNDRRECDIRAICALSDGLFLVVDHGNEKLKRLDSAYRLVDSIYVENIRDVCEIHPGLAASAMFSRLCGVVQLISYGMSLTKTKCFVVNDVCRSLTYIDGRLFVCHPTYVATYSLNGELLQTFKHDRQSQPLFTSIWGIGKNVAQRLIYVCDDEFGIVLLELKENLHRTVNSIDNTLVPRGICVTSTGHVVLCDKDSNSVMHIIPQGLRLKTILSHEDGIDKPRAVYYDSKRKKMLVACIGSSKMKVFSLEKTVLEELSLVVL